MSKARTIQPVAVLRGNGTLPMHVIYNRPRDYPDKVVVRVRHVGPGFELVSADCTLHATVEEARASLPPGLVCVPRHETDDPVIVEIWF